MPFSSGIDTSHQDSSSHLHSRRNSKAIEMSEMDVSKVGYTSSATNHADDKHSAAYIEHFEIEGRDGPVDQHISDEEAKLAAESSENFKWDLPLGLNVLALMMCYLASTVGLCVPPFSIAFIVESFPEDAAKAAWIAASASIANCVIQAFGGDLSDILGRKPFLLAGMVLAAIGTIISSRAGSMDMIIGGQAIHGVGFTLGYLAIPFSAEIVPKSQRPIMLAISSIASGIAYLAGPLGAGAAIKANAGGVDQGWRVMFYIMAILYALTFVLIMLFYTPAPRPVHEQSIKQRLLHIDWTGIFLVTAGSVLFLFGLQEGGTLYPWSSPTILSTLIIGALILVAFGIWEWKGTKTGIFHHSLFQHPNYTYSIILNVVLGIVLFGGQAYLPQEIAVLFTRDAVITAVYNIPFNMGTILGGFLTGIVMSGFKVKEARPIIVVGMAMTLLGNGLMAILQPHINFAAWFFPTFLLGIPIGLVISTLYVVISICTPNMYIASGMAVVGSIRALAGSVGIVMFSQIFQHKAASIIPSVTSKALLNAGLPASELAEFLELITAGETEKVLQLPNVTPVMLEVFAKADAQAYADSFRYVWYSLLPFAAICFAVAFLVRPTSAQLTNEVAAGVQKQHKKEEDHGHA